MSSAFPISHPTFLYSLNVRHIWKRNRAFVLPGVVRDVQDGTVPAESFAKSDGHRLAHPLRAGTSLGACIDQMYWVNEIKSNFHFILCHSTGWPIWSDSWVGLSYFGCFTFCLVLLGLNGDLAELAEQVDKLVEQPRSTKSSLSKYLTRWSTL